MAFEGKSKKRVLLDEPDGTRRRAGECLVSGFIRPTGSYCPGPVVSAELGRLADTGIVTPDTLVKRGRWWLGAPPSVSGDFSREMNRPRPHRPPAMLKGRPVSRVAASSAKKGRKSSPPPPPLPPTPPPVSSDSPRRKRVSRLAVALAAGGAVTVALLAGILLIHHSGKEVARHLADRPVATERRKADSTPVVEPPRQFLPLGPVEEIPLVEPAQGRPVGTVSRSAPAPSTPSPSPKDTGQASDKPLDPVALYAKSRGAVATILTKDDLGYDALLGSGFFIPRELVGPGWWEKYKKSNLARATPGNVLSAYLLTNYHVIRSAATAKLQLGNGRAWRIDYVVIWTRRHGLGGCVSRLWTGQTSKTHLRGKQSQLSVCARAGTADRPKVYAIGSPKGLEASLSEGIISGRREVAEGIWHLQTTAPLVQDRAEDRYLTQPARWSA